VSCRAISCRGCKGQEEEGVGSAWGPWTRVRTAILIENVGVLVTERTVANAPSDNRNSRSWMRIVVVVRWYYELILVLAMMFCLSILIQSLFICIYCHRQVPDTNLLI
jgi:hypothetical protein